MMRTFAKYCHICSASRQDVVGNFMDFLSRQNSKLFLCFFKSVVKTGPKLVRSCARASVNALLGEAAFVRSRLLSAVLESRQATLTALYQDTAFLTPPQWEGPRYYRCVQSSGQPRLTRLGLQSRLGDKTLGIGVF